MMFFVFVDGKAAPTKSHPNILQAMQEAERLALQPDNQMRKIYVMQALKVNEPVITRDWRCVKEPGSFVEVDSPPWK